MPNSNPHAAGIKKIIRQGKIPLETKPKSEAAKVALKNKPTYLPRSPAGRCWAIRIKARGITDAPKNPIKNLAAKSVEIFLEKPAQRLANENKNIHTNSIFFASYSLTNGPYKSAAAPYGSI